MVKGRCVGSHVRSSHVYYCESRRWWKSEHCGNWKGRIASNNNKEKGSRRELRGGEGLLLSTRDFGLP